jgi:hypothetical protein
MKQIINKILNKIEDNYILSKEKVELQNKHIFDDLRNNFKSELGKEALMTLYYYMSISEKALNHYRRRELLQANQNFNTSLTLEYSFIEPVKNGMYNLHYALYSYKNYVDGNYELAISQLDEAINLAIEQSKTFPYFISVIGEQWLNKIRVYIKLQNINETIKQTILLNQFLIYGNHENEIVRDNLKAVPIEHRTQMITHVINSIDLAFNKAFNGHNNFYETISKEILAQKELDTQIEDVQNAYKIIELKTTDTLAFLESININFESIKKIPIALQKYIFTEFLKICEEQNFEISRHPNNNFFFESLSYLDINLKLKLV